MTTVRVFFCGDIMTGRGIDQILAHPGDPAIHEPHLKSALDYVRLAEETSGPIPRRVEPGYIWGDALAELEVMAPEARIVNLETAVTSSDEWARKGINYRMSPANVASLTAAGIDCCALANNHVLDWGVPGLLETLATLHAARLRTAGAGCTADEAEAPAQIALASGGRVLVFGLALSSSGVLHAWAAGPDRPGVAFVGDLSERTIVTLAERMGHARRSGDIVVASVHWGPNWDYAVPAEEQRFARGLVESGAVDVFQGHSSHHAKAIEVFRRKLILYGCGDLITDYEGIGGHEEFRGDLGLMYFADVDARSGELLALQITPTQMRRFRACRASPADARWVGAMLEREGRRFGTRATVRTDGRIDLRY